MVVIRLANDSFVVKHSKAHRGLVRSPMERGAMRFNSVRAANDWMKRVGEYIPETKPLFVTATVVEADPEAVTPAVTRGQMTLGIQGFDKNIAR